MITIIAATNRAESMTLKVANEVFFLLKKMTDEGVKLLNLAEIDFYKLNRPSYRATSMYANNIREEYLIPAQRLIFIVPEYNGSFSGILKYFIDLVSTVDLKKSFTGKRAFLIGLAQGQAGNLRGLTHLAAILMHMGVNVVPKSLPISIIDNQFDEEGKLIVITKKRLQEYLLTNIKLNF